MDTRNCSIYLVLLVMAVFPPLVRPQSNNKSLNLQSEVVVAESRSAERPADPVLTITHNKFRSGVRTGQEESMLDLDPLALILLGSGLGILAADRLRPQE
jgi:hypothetical protein